MSDDVRLRFRNSVEFARTFSPEGLLRYLDMSGPKDYGEMFYDGMIVGLNFSKYEKVNTFDGPWGDLTLRIINQLYDRGVELLFIGARDITYDGYSIFSSSFIDWIEFLPGDGCILCNIHFLGNDKKIKFNFLKVEFNEHRFGERVGNDDFLKKIDKP
ncbi:MAG TPA: hypothetical protein VIM98_09910 [Dyella sp.]|uniref:hypothetical protein n=1 Tax=Dyella sp. TaxID=1869338 RepID=UPI002F929AB8